ncbi:MAG: enoyl-CoA hydratase/isomerase family protein [Candidatus Eremiobacteraeota bacterium]|nr:enoyl-CoA hydratase/isomerase family protein [Candidatus Eremiobacteraeota bacterium]
MNELVLSERRGRVALVTFNRPEARNAMTLEMYERLRSLCEEFAADENLRCVVFTGAGDRAFVAGTDIAEFHAFRDGDDALRYERLMDAVFGAVENLRMPTIAAVRGFCTGGGAALATVCDLRVGGPNTRFGYPVARTLGNCLSIANYARLERAIGAAIVKQAVFTAELLDGARLYELGYLTALTGNDDEVLPRALSIAETIAGNAPLTIEATKEALRRVARGDREGGDDLIVRCYTSEDFREGMRAFFEKRPVEWTGR